MTHSNRSHWLGNAALGIGIYFGCRQIVRRLRRFDLRNRLVLITGGSRGLGLLLARQYLAAGARVAICARDQEELDRAQEQLAAGGTGYREGNVWTGVCDITDRESVRDCVGRLTAAGGPVDVLVNNAGIIGVGPVETMTLDDYRYAMEVNFWGAVHMTHEVVGGMRRRGGGRIVNICSIGGKIAVPHLLPYSASKFAMAGWSTGLRTELKKDNIFVSTIFPGLMRTGSPRNVEVKGQHRKEYAWFAIGDSSPLTSMNADRAARRIVQACVNGEAEVVLSWQAKLATTLAALAPAAVSELSSAANWLMPRAGGIGTDSRRGYESESFLAPSMLTAPSDRAAVENNEM